MVCRRCDDDVTMVRAGRDPSGIWYLGRGPGRGVWWCDQPECEDALEIRHVARALRREVSALEWREVRALTMEKRSGL